MGPWRRQKRKGAQNDMYPVFLSYRRADLGDAQLVYEKIQARFPDDPEVVFFDKHSIPPAMPFQAELEERLRGCKVFVSVIGPNWALARLAVEGDFVRQEIMTAIRREIPILIVVMPGGAVPNQRDLPESLKHFVDRQAYSVAEAYKESDLQKFVKVLCREISREYTVSASEFARRVLLGEFSSSLPIGRVMQKIPVLRSFIHCRRGTEGSRLAWAALLTAFTTCALSVIAGVDRMSVELVRDVGPRASKTISFGYLSELNAGPCYIVIVPALILIAFRFIGAIQSALHGSESDRYLISRASAMDAGIDSAKIEPLVLIERWNKRIFAWLLPAILIAAFAIVVGTENSPNDRVWQARTDW